MATGQPSSSGRDRLMSAAMELAATTKSLASLGLREVARQAGLNPNTFYRHFRDFDELGLAMIESLGRQLRKGLRERRMRSALELDPVADQSLSPGQELERAQKIAQESVRLVLEFVLENRNAYTVGIRELFGSSAVLREAVHQLLEVIAKDITEDIFGALDLPEMPQEELLELARSIVRQMVFFSMDTLERPEQQEQILRQAERFILTLVWGAIAIRHPELVREYEMKLPAL